MVLGMKKNILLSLMAVLLLAACADNLQNMGTSVQPSSDAIIVCADTLHLSSYNDPVDYIYSRPDSFLLGNFYDNRIGTTRAEIMAQVACPVGFTYPEGAEVDSVELYLYYNTWFGDGYSPMRINVYEMNKSTFNYEGDYPSNLDVEDYCDKSELLGTRLVTAAQPTDSVYSSSSGGYTYYVRFCFSSDFADRFFKDESYTSVEDFVQFFKGLYITSDFGTACMLNVTQMDMTAYYHFTYLKEGRDTLVYNYKNFPANSEVRQVNRIVHPDRDEVMQTIDSITYLASPAQVFTTIRIPVKRLCDTVQHNLGDKRPYVNSATVRIDLIGVDDEQWCRPSNYCLLIRENAIDRFFLDKESVSDTCSILSQIAYTEISADNYKYYYSFDISTILLNELRKEPEQRAEYLDMTLLPVTVETTTDSYGNTSVSTVKHQQGMTFSTLKSGESESEPMKISLLYSGL